MFTEICNMSSTISLPTCSCCNKHIMPNDKCVKFNCPKCDTDLMDPLKCESLLSDTNFFEKRKSIFLSGFPKLASKRNFTSKYGFFFAL